MVISKIFGNLAVKRLVLAYAGRRFLACKIMNSAEEAIHDVESGSKILVGGFGLCGIPENLLSALGNKNANNLTIVSNNAGTDQYGISNLMKNKQVKKMISSYLGENKEFERQYLSGDIELEFVPQGTLVEKIRAGGAGIPAFYTKTGSNTWLEEGKIPVKYDQEGNIQKFSSPREVRTFEGIKYMLEESITGDFAFIKAWKADKSGNIIFRKSANNFNGPMCTAAKTTIVEVEEIVESGDIPPENVHIPGIYIDRIIKGKNYIKPIEKLVYHDSSSEGITGTDKSKLSTRDIICQRVACEVEDGMFINLGIGIPAGVANYVPKNITVMFHSENGVMGVGPKPAKVDVDPDLINAGKETITIVKGGSYFGSDMSFGMIRGGHLSITILGCMQVSQFGDLANWMIPRKLVKGMGGAMDLISCAKTQVIVATEHCSKDGKSKILKDCSLPLTGYRCVHKVITEKAVFTVCPNEGLTLVEKLSSLSVEEIKGITDCPFKVSPSLCNMKNVLFGHL